MKKNEDKNFDPILHVLTSPGSKHNDTKFIHDGKEKKNEATILISPSQKKNFSKKYKSHLIEQALKDPASVEIKTPEGWMTMKEAREKGFDAKTGEFKGVAKKPPQLEDYFKNKTPEQLENMKRKLDPRNMDLTEEQARQTGMPVGEASNFFPKNKPEVPQENPENPKGNPEPQPQQPKQVIRGMKSDGSEG